ncbi:acyl carrier protein [Chitinophaga rhizophila]|uniref:Carrier domain-containing protein n=1 Tax=Chitinophaga rhizophila TaxID=2866212 RepID=A0ABS7G8E2_9BACT|nr:phosphopantetheine-binding protein [Chitinophaga rhizophila]MBW8683054.1 hypothetical protein [Chitinophaga rhizophila]
METIALDSIKSKLKEIIVDDLNINLTTDQIRDDMSLYEDGIGLDSISIVNFIVTIEKRFDIQFGENEISSRLFSNINSLAEFIAGKAKD